MSKKHIAAGERAALILAANTRVCYRPGCQEPLVVTREIDNVVNFEIAHIRDELPPSDSSADIGWRYWPADDLTQEDRNRCDNLILLCPPCHKLIDRIKPRDFSPELLHEWKQAAEGDASYDLPDEALDIGALKEALADALCQRAHGEPPASAPVGRDGFSSEAAEGLPPVCRERIDHLRMSSPTVASQLVVLLSERSSLQPGALSWLVDEPPEWLRGAGYAAWEVIGDFIDGHDIGDSYPVRRLAVESGSPRRYVYLTQQAVACAERGDRDCADALIARVRSDHPLIPIARARIADDQQAVANEVEASGLLQSDDADLALFSIINLARACQHLKRLDKTREVLRQANTRFPGRAWLLWNQANTTRLLACQRGVESSESYDLLNEAAELALESRDVFRMWDGPSHRTVEIAMDALLARGDPNRAVGSCGDATKRGSD